MKKIILFSSFLLAFLLLALVPIFAQAAEAPGDVWEAVSSFRFLIGSFPGAVALLFFLVPFVLGGLNVTGKFLKYLATAGVVAAVTLLANVLGFGFLHGLKAWAVVLGGGLLMLCQVGIFSYEVARKVQDSIYERWNPWKKKQEDTTGE